MPLVAFSQQSPSNASYHTRFMSAEQHQRYLVGVGVGVRVCLLFAIMLRMFRSRYIEGNMTGLLSIGNARLTIRTSNSLSI